jgi:transposase
MKEEKKSSKRRSYEPDLKAEILKMLVSGRKVREISQSFGIAENLLYRWKTLSVVKTKSKTSESENSIKSAAEIAKLKAEIERLKTDREILKKALRLLSSSD